VAVLRASIVEGDKIIWGSEQTLPKYFFTCPNMTDLVGKFHVINCLNWVTLLAVPEGKVVSPKEGLHQKFRPKLTN